MIVIIKEDLSSTRSSQYRSGWNTFNFHDQSHVIFLILSREEGVTYIKLIENTTKAPHIDCCGVRNTKHDLRSSIKPRLDVSIYLLVFEATTTEINDFNT